MPLQNNKKGRATTVLTAFDLLEHLKELDGASLAELDTEIDLAKSTLHRYLSTLHDRGYLVKEESEYNVALRFLNLAEYARTRKTEYVMAKSKVDEFAEETGERVQFIVEEHGYGIFSYRSLGQQAVKPNPDIGDRVPLHSYAAGKAILAHIPKEDVHDILHRRGLRKQTENTLTDREDLFEELESVRDRGYAFNNQENILGLRAIGAPIRGKEGQIIGAISISGPTHRMKGDKLESKFPDLLLGSINELELNIANS